jgi:nicotinamide riboside kinase
MQVFITVSEIQARLNVLVEVSKGSKIPSKLALKLARHYNYLISVLTPFSKEAETIMKDTFSNQTLTEEERKAFQIKVNEQLQELNNRIVEIEDISLTEKELSDNLPPSFIFVFEKSIR